MYFIVLMNSKCEHIFHDFFFSFIFFFRRYDKILYFITAGKTWHSSLETWKCYCFPINTKINLSEKIDLIPKPKRWLDKSHWLSRVPLSQHPYLRINSTGNTGDQSRNPSCPKRNNSISGFPKYASVPI